MLQKSTMIKDLEESISKLKGLEIKLIDAKDKLYLRQSISNIDGVLQSLKEEDYNDYMNDCLEDYTDRSNEWECHQGVLHTDQCTCDIPEEVYGYEDIVYAKPTDDSKRFHIFSKDKYILRTQAAYLVSKGYTCGNKHLEEFIDRYDFIVWNPTHKLFAVDDLGTIHEIYSHLTNSEEVLAGEDLKNESELNGFESTLGQAE